MTLSSNKSPPACPTCAFNRVPSGSISRNIDGSLVCGTCNTKWREINNNNVQTAPGSANIFQPAQPSTDAVSIPDPHHYKSGAMAWKVAGVACLTFVIFVSLAILNQNQLKLPSTRSSALALADISIKSLNQRGRRIWSISAIVKNTTNNRLVIPALIFQAGKQGSSGYLKWKYQPAMQSLAPGTDFRFRTFVARPVGSPKFVRLKFANQI